LRGITCDHGRGCKRTDLTAQFTMKVSEIRKDSPAQPQFYCPRHRGLHLNISPTTGTPMGGDNAKN
jgi:hypothetical protein